MAFAKVYTVTQTHLKSEIITVEADVSKGLYYFSIVGLGDKTVEEAKERCGLAIKYSRFRSPRQSNEKTIISLAPAHVRKKGTVFDVAISLAYLCASEQIACDVSKRVILGELSLNGEVKRVRGIISMLQKAILEGFEEAIIPKENVAEAAVLAGSISIVPCETLSEVIGHVCHRAKVNPLRYVGNSDSVSDEAPSVSFDSIKGNELAKRALVVALSGGHNICMYGPPGTGKTMLAKASADLLPGLTFDEQVELTSIYSLSPEYSFALHTRPPFRAPHHSASYASIVGGGREVLPGEITLSHMGILFLDELPEFEKRVIDSLRQPLEDRKVRIARAGQKMEFPCDFHLICSMNPCPCGYLNTGIKECVCAVGQIQKYTKKISGPIVDRIEMWVEVSKVAYEKLMQSNASGHAEHDRAQAIVRQMRDTQKKKFGTLIGRMTVLELGAHIHLSDTTRAYYNSLAAKLQISARSYANILKVAFTISLLDNKNEILREHLMEALSYRINETYDT